MGIPSNLRTMKAFIPFLLCVFIIVSCEKETLSPQEQLVEAIQSKFSKTVKTADVFILQNDIICQNLDCGQVKISTADLTLRIHSREGLFMRGVDKYFEVVEWKELPNVQLRGNWVQDSPFEHTGEKCRGN